MILTVPCESCGQPLEVDEQTLANAAALGVTLSAKHDTCPDQPHPEAENTPQVTVRCQLFIYEVPDQIDPDVHNWIHTTLEPAIGLGTTVKGESIPTLVNGPITDWLNRTWPQVQEASGFAVMPPTPRSSLLT